MNNENYCNVFVQVLNDGHFLPLGQFSLTSRIKDVADMGAKYLFLFPLVPSKWEKNILIWLSLYII